MSFHTNINEALTSMNRDPNPTPKTYVVFVKATGRVHGTVKALTPYEALQVVAGRCLKEKEPNVGQYGVRAFNSCNKHQQRDARELGTFAAGH